MFGGVRDISRLAAKMSSIASKPVAASASEQTVQTRSNLHSLVLRQGSHQPGALIVGRDR
jgi:hypothetical protein